MKYGSEKHGSEGVDVCVIGTRIGIEVIEFHGRFSWGKTIPDRDVDENGSSLCRHQVSILLAIQLGRKRLQNRNLRAHNTAREEVYIAKILSDSTDVGPRCKYSRWQRHAVAAGNDNRDAYNYSPATTRKRRHCCFLDFVRHLYLYRQLRQG